MFREEDISEEIERQIARAEKLLELLEAGDPLSSILLAARRLAQDEGDEATAKWLYLEIHGVNTAVRAPTPLNSPERPGAVKFAEVRAVTNPDEVSGAAIEGGQRSSNTPRTRILTESVPEIERNIPSSDETVRNLLQQMAAGVLGNAISTDDLLQLESHNQERKRVLYSVRAEVYEYISCLLRDKKADLLGVHLIGVDYPSILQSTFALDSELGNDLRAALGRLRSSNPANWDASVLLCRNAVLKLGRSLWRVPGDSYESVLLGRVLNLGGESELNRLTAYIDCRFRAAKNSSEEKDYRHLATLAKRVYEIGSAGKQGVDFARAKQTVSDTFELVSVLCARTGLEPLMEV